jgi:hypothetical protein
MDPHDKLGRWLLRFAGTYLFALWVLALALNVRFSRTCTIDCGDVGARLLFYLLVAASPAALIGFLMLILSAPPDSVGAAKGVARGAALLGGSFSLLFAAGHLVILAMGIGRTVDLLASFESHASGLTELRILVVLGAAGTWFAVAGSAILWLRSLLNKTQPQTPTGSASNRIQ